MLEFLSGPDLYATVMMLRNAESRTLLLLEGPNDCRVMSGLIDKGSCKCIPGYGKTSVLSAMQTSREKGMSGVLAIVDADFSHLEGEASLSDDVLLTDYHDLDISLIVSPALDRFITQWGSETKVTSFMAMAKHDQLADFLLETSLPLGAIRLFASRNDMDLNFKMLRLKKYVDRDSLAISSDGVVLALLNQAGLLTEPVRSACITSIQDTLDEGHDPKQVCSGHDLTAIIAIGLGKALGTLSRAEGANRETVERGIRAAYGRDEFVVTGLYERILAWQARNAPWQVVSTAK